MTIGYFVGKTIYIVVPKDMFTKLLVKLSNKSVSDPGTLLNFDIKLIF